MTPNDPALVLALEKVREALKLYPAVYDILAALRGPDTPHNEQIDQDCAVCTLKEKLTHLIRAKVMGGVYAHDVPPRTVTITEADLNLAGHHYIAHIQEALKALGWLPEDKDWDWPAPREEQLLGKWTEKDA